MSTDGMVQAEVSRLDGVVPRWLVVGVVAILLVTAGLGGWLLWQRVAPAPAAESVAVLIDGGLGTATLGPPPATAGSIEANEAIRRAGALLSRGHEASGIGTRQALFSLAGADGTVLMAARHVWLVTYQGVSYSVETGCTCYVQSQPNTVVVLDAGTGQALLTYGAA